MGVGARNFSTNFEHLHFIVDTPPVALEDSKQWHDGEYQIRAAYYRLPISPRLTYVYERLAELSARKVY